MFYRRESTLEGMRVPPAPSTGAAFSFSGCAWLVAYHFGVGHVLQRRTDPARHVYLGASSGSIAALVLAAGVDCDEAFARLLTLARSSAQRRLGPAGRMSDFVRSSLEAMIPEKAHESLFGRLHVSITELPRLRNRRLPAAPFVSRKELINAILASCYIPFYYERPVLVGARPCIDGGLSDNQPVLNANTITVSPTGSRVVATGARPMITPSVPFARRDAFLPDPEVMLDVYEAGRADSAAYFDGLGWSSRLTASSKSPSENGFASVGPRDTGDTSAS